jgi:asparagine synthase (glutamine-hydrolysing)
MCGISGIYNFKSSPVNRQLLSEITDVIKHRGPDGFGYWFNSRQDIGFGHRRLSIIDLTEAGKQPMTYMGLTITFNGEVYNYIEIRNELKGKGYEFKTESDTEVLLAAYHYKGKHCLNDIDGMFAFAIWDENKNELFCARDRFGEKPFYYYLDDKRLIFGSEIKQLFASGINREADPEMLHKYCSEDSFSDSNNLYRTFYKNISQLPPSHYLLIKSDKTIVYQKYWEINYKQQNSKLTFNQAVENFEQLFNESIKRRMRSDVPIGTSLSGGLDSTSIVAEICRQNQDVKLNTFTASFPNFEKDETKFIKIFKEHHANVNDYYALPTADELTRDLDNLFYHQDEPIGSTSIYAQYRVMKLANEHGITVLLDGQGADEFIGGYNQYWPVRLREMFIANDKNYLSEKKNIKELIGFEQNINHQLAFMLKHPQTHETISRLKNLLVKRKTPLLVQPLKADFYLLKNINFKTSVNWSNLNSVLNHSVFYDGLQSLLRYADRNSMAHSREIRLPFLYHKLVEFVFSLPSQFKMHNGWSKIILRQSQNDKLPSEICWRKEKVGYATPQREWLKNDQIMEMEIDQRSKLERLNLFDINYLQKADTWKILNLYQLLK